MIAPGFLRRRFLVHDHLVTVVDLLATFIFAVQAALVGARASLDLFGIVVLAIVGSTGGGVIRDLVVGEVPPAAFRDPRYFAIGLVAAAAVIVEGLFGLPIVELAPPRLVDGIEAAGLALAAVAGARKALDYRLNGASVVVVATIGSCGGGILRDVLTARVPRVLHADFYATAAVIGALLMLALRRAGVRPPLAAALTGAAVFALRLAAIAGGWSLPHLR